MSFDEIVWIRRMARTGSARAVREASGVKQAEMAREIGVDRSTLLRWERGEQLPTREGALRWAAMLRSLGA